MTLADLIDQAAQAALADAGLELPIVDEMFVGTMASGAFVAQEHVAALVADRLGLFEAPVTRVEAACASGGMALRHGYLAIAGGLCDVVLVIGAEKMTDVSSGQAGAILATAGHSMHESAVGASFPALYALMARAHMCQYGTTEQQMALCAVKNHAHALNNPYAHFKKAITVSDVMESGYIASPLKLLDCSPISDGAAALILCSTDFALSHGLSDRAVSIIASAQAHDTFELADRASLSCMDATMRAASRAYAQADLKPADIDCAEVHDCFTIAELLALEGLGFCAAGQSGTFVASGATAQDGIIPVNMSGGLKAKGHPVGATGVAQAVEIYLQLLAKAGARQVAGATKGLIHNVGGSGATAIVHILSRE